MEIKRSQYIIEGMHQDLGETVFNPKFSFENHNIRISVSDNNSLLSITNERGNKKVLLRLKKFTNLIYSEYDLAIKRYRINFTYPTFSKVEVNYHVDNVPHSLIFKKGATSLVVPEEGELELNKVYPEWDSYYYYSISENTNDAGVIVNNLQGLCLGYGTLNNSIIIFTHSEDNIDRIYKITNLSDVYLLFEGNLNFDPAYPIETLSDFESESVQKIYWIDGKNPLRFINITKPTDPNRWTSSSFDFSPDIEPYNFIDIVKSDTGGEFSPGTIQYAFTYISDWHGVETNIVNTSSLNYISYSDRGAKEDETCYNSFTINLTGLDPHYKYVRVYSIHRTSLDSTPTVKILGEYEIQLPQYLGTDGTEDYLSYWELRSQFKAYVESLNISSYTNASWDTPLDKITNEFNTFMELINTKFGINIGSVANGVFTLQQIFEFIWKGRSYYVNIVDTGTIGTNEDPTKLLYKNSSNSIVTTFASKDSTLFVGGYKIPGASNIEDRNIKLLSKSTDNIIGIEVYTLEERHNALYTFLASVSRSNSIQGVESDIKIQIAVEGYDVPIVITIPKGSLTSRSDEGRYSGTEPKWSASIIKDIEGNEYYSDNYYTYYLSINTSEGTSEAKPSSAILKGSDGYSEWAYRDYIPIEDDSAISTYTYRPYTLQNSSKLCKQFKKGQPYRFALQGQFSNGQWGDPIVIETVDPKVIISDYESVESDFIEQDPEETQYTLNNICPLSFIVDPVLDETGSPSETLNDIYITEVSNQLQSNLLYDKTGRAIPTDINTNIFNPGKPTNTYFYIPSAAYNDDNSLDKNTFKGPNFNWKGSASPWKYIYNKDKFHSTLQNKDIPINKVSSYLAVKNNYTVGGKTTKSMWLGSLNKPQSTTELWDDSLSLLPPGDFGNTLNIENTEFKANTTCLYLNKFKVTLAPEKVQELYDKGYRKVRLLYVIPTKTNRKYPAQGILTNTIFTPKLRNTNSCWAYTDYLARPREVYRVWNERTCFFTNWATKTSGDTRQYNPGSPNLGIPGYVYTVKSRLLANPYYYPYIHRFITSNNDVGTEDHETERVWNTRPNYGHLLTTYREVLGQYGRGEKTWYPQDNRRMHWGMSENDYTTADYTKSKNSTDGFPYIAKQHVYVPFLQLEPNNYAHSNSWLTFDDSIVNFWSPDIEFQESDKNYYENTIEGFQIRGLAGVVSTTTSSFYLDDKGNTAGVLGYSDVSNYHSMIDLDDVRYKGFTDEYTQLTNKEDTQGRLQACYLARTSLLDISSSIHRLIMTGTGEYDINSADNSIKYPHIWDNVGVGSDQETSSFKSKIFSFKKYCLNTLFLRDLRAFRYLVNTPTFITKGDSIKSLLLYKTGITGETIAYNPGMDELLLYYNKEGSSYVVSENVPIQYKANTHLAFSFAKGGLINLKAHSDSSYSLEENKEYTALPVLPEFSAWAKYHNNQKIIGSGSKDLYILRLYWWPSNTSTRPSMYQDTSYSVTDSLENNDGSAVWKVALECSTPIPVDVTVSFSYKLGFWKSSKRSNKTGHSTITLRAGQQSTMKKFEADFTTLRSWSTINVVDLSIKSLSGTGWKKASDLIAYSSSSVLTLIKDQTYLSNAELVNDSGNLVAPDPWYLDGKSVYVEDMFDPIQEETLSSEYDNVGIDSIIYHRNLPYFLLVDLERSDEYLYSDWGGSGIYKQIWVPCGDPVILPPKEYNSSCTVEATEGDVFVGRYDCLRVVSDNDKIQRVNDIVSFICESYTNPDGRSDKNRYNTDTREVNFDNFNVINHIYSQSNNYFSYNKSDYRVLEETGIFKNQFSWSLPKSPDSLVDPWTNLTFASTYNLNGEYGSLNRIVAHNNQLYAFQDKAIANILFNSRIQVPTSDGMPIELANSNKVDGIRYITTTSGCQNKWSVKATSSGIYYIDNRKKNLNLISAEGISNVTERKGLKSWALKSFGYNDNVLSLEQNEMSNWVLSRDTINKDLYIHDKDQCLIFSESLANFMSFVDYKNIPFIFNSQDNLLSIYSRNDATDLYTHHTGEYNKFYDLPKVTSSIDYLVNPEPSTDKVFNNIEFRADAFNSENYLVYNPYRTLDSIRVMNEFQNSSEIPLVLYKNLRKKFRAWRAYIPRDSQEYKLNRIRNPWMRVKLSYTPTEEEDNKLVMHDLIVNYTI